MSDPPASGPPATPALRDSVATIYCQQRVARAARDANGGIAAADVLYASGPFRRGDILSVVVHGVDGGQRIFAIAEACCDGSGFGPGGPDREVTDPVVHADRWRVL